MNPKWYSIGLTYLGVAEIPGPKANAIINKFHDRVGFPNLTEDDAWCGAFVGNDMVEAGLPIPKVAVRASAWLDWGVPIKVPKVIDSKYDVPVGAVGVKKRVGGYHVFMFSHWENEDHTKFYALEGNASNRVQLGVHNTAEVIGWRWPEGVPIPVAQQPLRDSNIIRVGAGAVLAGATAVGGNSTEIIGAVQSAKQLSAGSIIGAVFGVIIVVAVIIMIIQRSKQKTSEKAIGEVQVDPPVTKSGKVKTPLMM